MQRNQDSNDRDASLASGRDAQATRVRVGVGTFVLLALLYWQWMDQRLPGSQASAPEAPTLWGAASETCDATPDAVRFEIARLIRAGDAKRQRYPFAPEDGIEAVTRYLQAAACLEDADDPKEAEAVRRQARSLQDELERTYRSHQLRLKIAVEQGDAAAFSREAQQVKRLLGARAQDFQHWLDRTLRQLERGET